MCYKSFSDTERRIKLVFSLDRCAIKVTGIRMKSKWHQFLIQIQEFNHKPFK